jgi:N-acetylmuramic acid 6-phosphate etherase
MEDTLMDNRATIGVRSPTEARNRRTLRIDEVPTLELLRLLNAEDTIVLGAVAQALPELARAVEAALEHLARAG